MYDSPEAYNLHTIYSLYLPRHLQPKLLLYLHTVDVVVWSCSMRMISQCRHPSLVDSCILLYGERILHFLGLLLAHTKNKINMV